MRTSVRARRVWRVLTVALVLAMSVITFPTAKLALAAPGDGTFAFRDLGYGDQTARSMDATVDYFFRLPAGRVPATGSRLSLRYSHSPLLRPNRSTMTVAVNGQSLTSVFLNDKNVGDTTLDVPLPTAGFS